jgi:hypothetical protein
MCEIRLFLFLRLWISCHDFEVVSRGFAVKIINTNQFNKFCAQAGKFYYAPNKNWWG